MTAQRPNVLLITTDQQRWDALALNRPTTALQTPNLDALAAGGLNCSRAYSNSPVCIPARRSLLSGLHPQTHGLRRYQDGLDWDAPVSVPGTLSQVGYQTQLIGKLHLHPQRKRYGYDHMIRTESPNDRWDVPVQPVNDWARDLKRQGIQRQPNNIGVDGNGRVGRPFDLAEQYHHTSWLADQAVDFITETRDPSCPYFLHLSFWAPHPPLIPPQAYWDRYANHGQTPAFGDWTPDLPIELGIPPASATGPFPAKEIAEATRGYYGLVNHVDDRIGYVLSRTFEYQTARKNEPTLIIFTSDHGEMLGDHHFWRKSLGYEASAHVPFFIAWRNMDFKPGTFDGLVSLEDVAATVFDCCGVELPELYNSELESHSLAPALNGESCHTRERLIGECDKNFFVVEGNRKYLWYADTHEEQLFAVLEDVDDCYDLSGQEPEQLNHFRGVLQEYLQDRDGLPFSAQSCQPCAKRPPRSLLGDRALAT